jgi:hypothetical protein
MATKQPWEFSTEESEQYVRDSLEKLAGMPWNHHRGGDWEEEASEEDEAIDKAFEHAGAFGFYEADVLARVIEETDPMTAARAIESLATAFTLLYLKTTEFVRTGNDAPPTATCNDPSSPRRLRGRPRLIIRSSTFSLVAAQRRGEGRLWCERP